MRLSLLFTAVFMTFIAPIFGSQYTFILQDVDSNQILVQEGDTSSMSPYCTFNIILSLIGFDTNVLQDTKHPVWPYKEEYKTCNTSFPEKWEASQNPITWIQNSCVWYSQELTQRLGLKTLADYVVKFSYGNQNLMGDAGKANGLTHAWIGSSLQVSPLEQVRFINQLVKEELPVSVRAQELTKAILFVEKLSNGMMLYGKTGSGEYAKGREESSMQVGWFVGWVEKGAKRLSFAYRVHGTDTGGHITSVAAKEQLKQRLLQLSL